MITISVMQKLKMIAWSFRNALTADERKDAVRAAFLIARDDGVEALARLTGRNVKKLRKIGEIGQFRQEANRWSRGRGPNPRNKWLEREAKEIPLEIAGLRKSKLVNPKKRMPGSFEGNFR